MPDEGPTPSNLERTRRDYDGMWARSKDPLSVGKVVPDRPPASTGRRWGITAILRPTPEVASSLAVAAREIGERAGEHQLVYDASNLHTTLCSIEVRRLSGAPDEDRTRRYAEALHEAAERARAVRVVYRGLTASLSGVLAQGWPTSDARQELRHAVYRRLDARGLATEEAEDPRRTAHATLVIFANFLRDPTSLAHFVEEKRYTDYGACTFGSVELVTYERTERAAKLVPLVSVPLPFQ